MLDIAITLGQGLVALLLGYMGFQVTLHPPDPEDRARVRRFQWAFGSLALIAVGLIVWAGVRSEMAKNDAQAAQARFEQTLVNQARDADQKQKERDEVSQRAQAERDERHRQELSSVAGQLEDIKRVATTRYPGLNPRQALDRLLADTAEIKTLAGLPQLARGQLQREMKDGLYVVKQEFVPSHEGLLMNVRIAVSVPVSSTAHIKSLSFNTTTGSHTVDQRESIDPRGDVGQISFGTLYGSGTPFLMVVLSEPAAVLVNGNQGIGMFEIAPPKSFKIFR